MRELSEQASAQRTTPTLFSTLSPPEAANAHTITPSTNSLSGIVRNLACPSTGPWCFDIEAEQKQYAPSTINLRLAAVRRVAYEAAESGLLSPELAAGIRRVKGVRRLGIRVGNWLTAEQGKRLLESTGANTLRSKRNRAMLSMLIGCGLRRGELLSLTMKSIQLREERWVIADLIGKGKHIRTVPVPVWVKRTVDAWTAVAKITAGAIFRRVSRMGKLWGAGITPKAIWHVVKAAAQRAGISNLAPHDLRRSCARFCHLSGGELEQIQFLLGHASVQTTERYLGCKQKLGHPVNDLFELRTEGRPQENDDESATVKASKASDPVEKASGQGVECRHGGPDHD